MHPDRVGPYLIEKKIGAGGMGTVYLGRHRETDQQAAVKVLPASLAREDGFVARFEREINAMTQLSNPHIVKFFENGEHDESYYYSMEYVDGETLTDRLRREKRIAWREAIEISLQICIALKAAHDAGIVHRDLKPSNLLMARDGTVKLTDFGVAQVFAATRLTATGGIIGTAEFMSPEQAQGKRATKKSDLYALGAVLYVMITGRPPFRGKTSLEVIQKQRYGRFDRPGLFVPEMPHWLEEIILQLLEKEPDKRFSDAYVLSLRLREVIKKVELSSQESTEGGSFHDGTSPTIALNSDPGPGQGTLMRDLIREEVKSAHRRTPLGEWLNNTWVLVALFVVLVAGGYAWFQGREVSPERKLEQAKHLLEQTEDPDWQAAGRLLNSLLDDDPDRWKDEVDPLLEEVRKHEILAQISKSRRRRDALLPTADAKGFLEQADRLIEIGDFAQAETVLTALVNLLADQPGQSAYRELAQRKLDGLHSPLIEPQNDQQGLLETSLKLADEFTEQGRHDQARAIWKSVVELFGSDPRAKERVQQAQHQLKRTIQAE